MRLFATLLLFLKRLWLEIASKWKGGTADPNLRISRYSLVSEAQSGPFYDFTYQAQLTNRGIQAVPGVIATLVPKPAFTVVDGQLSFGETRAGCTVRSQDTFTLRRSSPEPYRPASLEASLKWNFELNTAPIADAGPDQTAQVGQSVTLDGSGSSDADGDPVSYRWTLLSQPPGSQAALTGTDTVQVSLVSDVAGEYRVQLVVHDGKVASEPDTALVTVAVPQNRDPQITSTPITSAIQDSPYSYDVEATDPDGDTLSFVLTLAPAGMSIDDVTGLITWVPAQTEDYPVTVTATDGRGGSASQSYTLTVAPALVTVPNVVGLASLAAEAAITAANLVVGAHIGRHSGTVPAGQVISQDPAAGTAVARGTAVNLVASLGQQGDGLPPTPRRSPRRLT
jgi:Putative Ig domain/PKD domain/PASTA domain